MKHFNKLEAWCTDQKHLYYLFLVVLLVPHLFLFYTEPMDWATRYAFLLVPLGAYMALLAAFRKPGIMVWLLFPLLFLGAFQLVLLYLFGESIIATDMFLNLFTTNSTEAMELLDKLAPSVVGVVVLYVPTLVLAVVSVRSKQTLGYAFRKKALIRAAWVFVAGACFIQVARYTNDDFRVRLHLYPVNVFYNIRLAAERWKASVTYPETSAAFAFNARSQHDPQQREVYIMVIGETARAINFGIYGYERNTTPGLQQTPNLVHFTDVLSQANATHKSVPILMSAASAENYDCMYSQKSIITAFKEAGFRTAFFSNQLPNHSFIDYFAGEADVHVFLKEDPEEALNPYDTEMVKMVSQFLSGHPDDKIFIVLHCYGSHFNYYERYPKAEACFTPDKIDKVDRKHRDVLVNAYDNSIRATDKVLSLLIRRLSEEPGAAALLYTSDHGEDMLDDHRNRFLHSSPVPTYYQLHVPYLLWTSDAYNRAYPDILPTARANSNRPVMSNTFFHTMLSLGGIGTDYRNDTLSVVSSLFRVTPRNYLNDHNKPLPLDKVGFKEEDLEMFRANGLQYP